MIFTSNTDIYYCARGGTHSFMFNDLSSGSVQLQISVDGATKWRNFSSPTSGVGLRSWALAPGFYYRFNGGFGWRIISSYVNRHVPRGTLDV